MVVQDDGGMTVMWWLDLVGGTMLFLGMTVLDDGVLRWWSAVDGVDSKAVMVVQERC